MDKLSCLALGKYNFLGAEDLSLGNKSWESRPTFHVKLGNYGQVPKYVFALQRFDSVTT